VGLDEETQHDITQLLQRWSGGDAAAFNKLLPLVYRELRAIAQNYLNRERSGHTLQSTALVHELYERMVRQELPQWQNRAQFFAVAALLMRRILVDHARGRQAAKRGGDVVKLSVDELANVSAPVDLDIVALDDALTQLAKLDPQQSRVVEMKIFVGLSNDDMAEVLGISKSTVKRDWETARVWLYRQLLDNRNKTST
jgi:RNA polymerase sigma factor (TIGR02999 family)